MASHASVQFGEEQKSPPRRPSSEISEGTVCFLPDILACVRRCASSDRTIRYRIARGSDF
jgi:hypothetical protein